MAPGPLTQYPALATTAGRLRANLATVQNDLGGELGLRADPTRVLPMLLTVDEAAHILRSSRRAIYAMVERRQLPGVIRIRRRVLLRSDDLLHWLNQKRASSPEE